MNLQNVVNDISASLVGGNPNYALQLCNQLLHQNIQIPEIYWLKGHALTLTGEGLNGCSTYKEAMQRGLQNNLYEYFDGTHRLTLKDTPGSCILIDIMEEMYRDDYGIGKLDLPEGATILDVGAHVGLFSAVAARHFPTATIHAFEPVADTQTSLLSNLERNNIHQVHLHPYAVGDHNGEIDFYVQRHDSAVSTAFVNSSDINYDKFGFQKISVPMRTLDSIFDELDIKNCDLLKLDCEGAEFEILSQSKCLQNVKQIIMEVHLPSSSDINSKHEAEYLLREKMKHLGDSVPGLTVCSIVKRAF
ncbi:FkbM family methyltransferase [Terasakiella sp. A23]|uniref:FkbM family methyltransferase n=1 Tax=Terasakiella sp. FCG-A23 TaxID=3080561 RepID=UPI002954F40E|nr:FkbM family methyltransferase [Terasakiella sp. A23]MDV7339404.1 FkbM family methyltransferase [Terasakiella sp. A23]